LVKRRLVRGTTENVDGRKHGLDFCHGVLKSSWRSVLAHV
jgi:hypothetical protein